MLCTLHSCVPQKPSHLEAILDFLSWHTPEPSSLPPPPMMPLQLAENTPTPQHPNSVAATGAPGVLGSCVYVTSFGLHVCAACPHRCRHTAACPACGCPDRGGQQPASPSPCRAAGGATGSAGHLRHALYPFCQLSSPFFCQGGGLRMHCSCLIRVLILIRPLERHARPP